MSGSAFAFVIYLVVLLVIGYLSFRMTRTFSDFVIASRNLNAWTTSLSAQASDMSAWLLLGLPGLAYAMGLGTIWVAIGIMAGTLFNWHYIATRLRRFTELTDSITISDFFAARYEDNSHILRVISAVVIIVFFIINISAELVASGKLLNASFGFDYNMGLLIGVGVIVLYTLFGGFFAVSWTDFVQGLLMVFGLVVLPLFGLNALGGFPKLWGAMQTYDVNLLDVLAGETGWMALSGVIIGSLAIGLGYPGQPHILVRFMAIKRAKQLKVAMLIAMVWVILSLYGAIFIGFLGHGFLAPLEDPEQVLPLLAGQLLSPWVAGILVAAVMAAIMSSVDSYLLVSSTAVAEDFYKKIFRKDADDKVLTLVGRICVILVALAAFILARPGGVVFTLALYAWGGLAAGFGPLVILSLYWKRTTMWGAATGMVVGMGVTILWYNVGLSNYIYELVPAFFLSLISIVIVSLFTSAPSADILDKFELAKNPISSEKEVLEEHLRRK
jgi:sodium/proline symporter